MSDFISVWDFDLLWGKCKAYAQRAHSESRDSPMFAFWSALLIEFLGRATLAKVHPVLLADPREGDNILYAFGYSKNLGPPKSIVAKTVFDRCSKIVSNFTTKEINGCLLLIDKRNEELHSGSAPFVDFDTKLWLANYFKSCQILLEFCDLTLEDLFGKDDAVGAKEMITEVDKKTVVEVNKRIAGIKSFLKSMTKEDLELTIRNGTEKAKASIRHNAKLEKCICCGASGLLSGKRVSVSEDKLQDGEIVYDNIILPTQYTCFSCGLKLFGHQELIVADYGGQFTEKCIWDPAEYHGIGSDELEIDPSEYYDYGND